MEERRQDRADILAELKTLRENQDRMCHLLEGNGQPGFIAQTRHALNQVKQWQMTHDALTENERESNRRTLTLYGFLVTVVAAVAHFIGGLLKK